MPPSLIKSKILSETIANEINELSGRHEALDRRHASLDSVAKLSEDSALGIYIEMYSLEKKMKKIRDMIYILFNKLASVDSEHPLVKDFL